MKGVTKKRKVVSLLRTVFADNLKRAMERRYAGSTNTAKALERDSGISDSTINRWLVCGVAPNLDALESVAAALKMKAHELITPYHGLEDAPPPPTDRQAPKTGPRPPFTRPGAR